MIADAGQEHEPKRVFCSQPRLIETASIDIDLPTSQAAPILIEVPGGFEPGALTPAIDAGAQSRGCDENQREIPHALDEGVFGSRFTIGYP